MWRRACRSQKSIRVNWTSPILYWWYIPWSIKFIFCKNTTLVHAGASPWTKGQKCCINMHSLPYVSMTIVYDKSYLVDMDLKVRVYTRVKAHNVLQVCKQVVTNLCTVVSKLCSHCLFHVVAESLVQAVNNL